MNDAEVKIWGKTVGAVTWDPSQGRAFFRYDPKFQKLGIELAPLQMPVVEERVFSFPSLVRIKDFQGLPGLLSDSLPDDYGHRLIDQWLASQGRAPGSMNPVEKLCFIGQRGMGALEFEPAQFKKPKKKDLIAIDGLVRAAQKLLNERAEAVADLNEEDRRAMQEVIRVGTSAGGARSKAIVAYNAKKKQFRSGQLPADDGFDHFLLKLDGVKKGEDHLGDGLGYGRIEMAYSDMAKAAGIIMMPCQLIEENGRAHFMTKRFDRDGHDTKHHIQTFAAMNHIDYDQVGTYSYEQIFQTMRMLHMGYPEAEQMYRRVVFNVLGMNRDDHAKNFSFMLKEGEDWHLTPAYDITYAYDPKSRWHNTHATTINGKVEGITREDLLAVAKKMNIKKPEVIINEVKHAIALWPEFGDQYGVEENEIMSIQKTFPTI
jgi:serine/threonine-protein kinase HipA